MKDATLTAEERAAALAKIKEAARLQAQSIVEQDGHLKLEQDTMARKLSIAADDVTALETGHEYRTQLHRGR